MSHFLRPPDIILNTFFHQLLPPPKQISYNLRSRGHGLTLSAIPSEFKRINFLYSMLYNDRPIYECQDLSYFSLTLLFTLCTCFVDCAFVIVVIKESYCYCYCCYYYYSSKTLPELARSPTVRRAAIDRYLLPAGPQQSLLLWAHAGTDWQTPDRCISK